MVPGDVSSPPPAPLSKNKNAAPCCGWRLQQIPTKITRSLAKSKTIRYSKYPLKSHARRECTQTSRPSPNPWNTMQRAHFQRQRCRKKNIEHALPTSSPCTRQCKNDLMDWTHRTRSLIDPVILSPAAKCIKRELRRFSGNHPTRSRSSWYGEKQNGRIS